MTAKIKTKAQRYAEAWDALEAAAGTRITEIIGLGKTSRAIADALSALGDPLATLVAEVARWDEPAPKASASEDRSLRELARSGDEDAFDALYG